MWWHRSNRRRRRERGYLVHGGGRGTVLLEVEASLRDTSFGKAVGLAAEVLAAVEAGNADNEWKGRE